MKLKYLKEIFAIAILFLVFVNYRSVLGMGQITIYDLQVKKFAVQIANDMSVDGNQITQKDFENI